MPQYLLAVRQHSSLQLLPSTVKALVEMAERQGHARQG
jgi:hypothetical protein